MANTARAVTPTQSIRFCRSDDGVRIAYAVHGAGPPLVIDACWLSHLQYDWQSPVWRHYLVELGKVATVIRFDERGHGLSDRDVADFTLESRVADLEAVVDHAGLERFALMAMSQGGPVSIDYVARHPERVSRLVFYSSYSAAMRDPTPEEIELDLTFEQMIKVGWARPESAFRRVFTSMMIPGATEEQMRWLDELQRVAVSGETAYAARRERKKADVTHLLPELDLPTLVLHSRDDQMNDFEDGRFLAANIAGARLVALEGSNHVALEDEPAWPVLLAEITEFLEPDRHSVPGAQRPDLFDGALRAGAPGAEARGRRTRQCRDRGDAVAERPHGGATPAERLGQARDRREVRPHRGRRPAAHPGMTPTRTPPRPPRRTTRDACTRRCGGTAAVPRFLSSRERPGMRRTP